MFGATLHRDDIITQKRKAYSFWSIGAFDMVLFLQNFILLVLFKASQKIKNLEGLILDCTLVNIYMIMGSVIIEVKTFYTYNLINLKHL